MLVVVYRSVKIIFKYLIKWLINFVIGLKERGFYSYEF